MTSQKRHIGKVFEIELPIGNVLALCIYHTSKLGYLLKWFPLEHKLTDLQPEETKEFWYTFYRIDAEIRSKNAREVARFPDMEPHHPPLRTGTVPYARNQIKWFVDFGTGDLVPAEHCDLDIKRLSDVGLAGRLFINELYVNRISPEDYFHKQTSE